MLVRSVRSLDEFLDFAGDPDDFAETVSGLWASTQSGSHWCFVAEDRGRRLGRLGLYSAPTIPGDLGVSLGELRPVEVFAFGLALPWDDDWESVGHALLTHAVGLEGDLPDSIQLRINCAVHSHHERRRRVVESAGLRLFQEKEGVLFEASREVQPGTPRLRFRTLAETGVDALVDVVARVGAGTLDRNDAFYYSRMAPQEWAHVYVSLFEAPETTLVGFSGDDPVGFISVGPFDEPDTATVAFVGVVPEHRGRRYVDELLLAGTHAAVRAGYRRILSDVDVENQPMLDAMARCGHLARATNWHVWHYRDVTRA